MNINELNLAAYESRQGAFATIVIDSNRKLAYKLFKSYNHPDLDGTGKEEHPESTINNFRIETFKSEVEAYIKVQDSELLKSFTPKYYGTEQFDRIVWANTDISNQYLPYCCMKLEYIDGQDYKLAELLGYDIKEVVENRFKIDVTNIIQEFKKNGILYLEDASAIVSDHSFKIIDFGIRKVGDYPNIEL